MDGSPLVFFHFHGLSVDGDRFYFKHLPYLASTTPVIRDEVYHPYCRALREEEAVIGRNAVDAPRPRQASVFPSIHSSRAAILRLLAKVRGDYLDLPATRSV